MNMEENTQMLYLKNIGIGNIFIIALLLALALCSVYIFALYADISKLQRDKDITQMKLNLLNDRLKTMSLEHQERLKQADMEALQQSRDFEQKIKNIRKWEKKDANCSDAIGFINNYSF